APEFATLHAELELREVRAGEMVREIGRREPQRAVREKTHHLSISPNATRAYTVSPTHRLIEAPTTSRSSSTRADDATRTRRPTDVALGTRGSNEPRPPTLVDRRASRDEDVRVPRRMPPHGTDDSRVARGDRERGRATYLRASPG